MAKKRKPPKERNLACLAMILHRKGGKHKDRKKDRDRNACRGKFSKESPDGGSSHFGRLIAV